MSSVVLKARGRGGEHIRLGGFACLREREREGDRETSRDTTDEVRERHCCKEHEARPVETRPSFRPNVVHSLCVFLVLYYRTGQEDAGGLMLGARNTAESPGIANLSFFL